MSSSRASDRPELDRLEEDIPTTREDVVALRRARARLGSGFSLEDMNLLNPPEGLPERPPRRRSAEGWDPFEL